MRLRDLKRLEAIRPTLMMIIAAALAAGAAATVTTKSDLADLKEEMAS